MYFTSKNEFKIASNSITISSNTNISDKVIEDNREKSNVIIVNNTFINHTRAGDVLRVRVLDTICNIADNYYLGKDDMCTNVEHCIYSYFYECQ